MSAAARPAYDSPTPQRILERGLSEREGRSVVIAGLERRPLHTYSTHPIHRLEAVLADGRRRSVIFKRLRAKPGKDIARELLLYERMLSGGRFGAPELYASLCDPVRGRYWLFLEDVGGFGLGWCETDEWEPAFRWLARMHAELQDRAEELRGFGCLPEHDEAFYRGLAGAAGRSLVALGTERAHRRFTLLAEEGLESTVEYLTSQPRTFVHGDMSCKNVMVQPGLRIRAIDWEWAAIGCAAWDLSKLLAGWGSEKSRFLAAYLDELDHHAPVPLDRRALERALVHCDALKVLWYLRWWVDGCEQPAVVDRMLDDLERRWGMTGEASSSYAEAAARG